MVCNLVASVVADGGIDDDDAAVAKRCWALESGFNCILGSGVFSDLDSAFRWVPGLGSGLFSVLGLRMAVVLVVQNVPMPMVL